MTQRCVLLMALGIAVFTAGAAPTAPLVYVVDDAGLIVSIDTDTDTVVGIRQVPGLARIAPASQPDAVSASVPTSPDRSSSERRLDQAGKPRLAAAGRSLLTPHGDKIVVLDPLPGGLYAGFLVDAEPSGRLYVYDVATGVKLGQVSFAVRGGERLGAIHPRGEKAYLTSNAGQRGDMTITIVSLTSFRVLKELIVPRGDLSFAEVRP